MCLFICTCTYVFGVRPAWFVQKHGVPGIFYKASSVVVAAAAVVVALACSLPARGGAGRRHPSLAHSVAGTTHSPTRALVRATRPACNVARPSPTVGQGNRHETEHGGRGNMCALSDKRAVLSVMIVTHLLLLLLSQSSVGRCDAPSHMRRLIRKRTASVNRCHHRASLTFNFTVTRV
jgi:hypothetical protein